MVKTEIGEYLKQLSRQEYPLITYKDLAIKFGYSLKFARWGAHPFSRIFDWIDRDDANNNRPFRTSLVIKENKMPGNGFFKALKKYKNITIAPEHRQATWEKEVVAVCEYNWNKV